MQFTFEGDLSRFMVLIEGNTFLATDVLTRYYLLWHITPIQTENSSTISCRLSVTVEKRSPHPAVRICPQPGMQRYNDPMWDIFGYFLIVRIGRSGCRISSQADGLTDLAINNRAVHRIGFNGSIIAAGPGEPWRRDRTCRSDATKRESLVSRQYSQLHVQY